MKKTVLALILTFCAAFVALAFSAQADTALTLSVAASGGDYATVEKALADVEAMAKNGELNEKGVVLVLTGTHTATSRDGILFGQKTVFLPDGKKLPVTLTGGTLLMPTGSVACTNDYTFREITVPFDDAETRLFAGSGEVTLESIKLNLNGNAEYKSRFFGDTFTAKVFEGWTEEHLARYSENGLLVSSMTLGEGFVYENTSGYPYAAVGSSTDFAAVIGKKTVTAKNTSPKLIVDGASLQNTMARAGSNPVGNSVLAIKSGSVRHLYAAGHSLFSELEGNITVTAEGGTFKGFVRLINKLHLKGNLNVTLKNMDLMGNTAVTNGCMIQILFGTVTVEGDVCVAMENVKADRFYNAFADGNNLVTGDVCTFAKNCNFSQLFYGGVAKGTVFGNVENSLENVSLGDFEGADTCSSLGNALLYTGKKESVGNVVNRLTDVSFHSAEAVSVHLGSSAGTQTGTVTNVLERVTTSAATSFYCGSTGGTANSVHNQIKNSTFGAAFFGASSGGTVVSAVTNDLDQVTFENYAYLAGSGGTVRGEVVNRLTDCVSKKYYVFGGVNGGKILNSHLEYGVRNYIEGGSYHGFWGGSASMASTHEGNIYTEVASGEFFIYDSSRPNSFSGGCRNTRHAGNATSLIRGGIFHGLVAGGSIPNSESYAQNHSGTASLTVAGGTFKGEVIANSLWGGYPSACLILDNEKSLAPYSFAFPVVCDTFIAASEQITFLQDQITCKDLIAKGTGTLQICNRVQCENFICENSAPSPAVYDILHCKNLNMGEKPLLLGAKAQVCADSVTGSVHLQQTEFWLKQTYFTSPAHTSITLSAAEGVPGNATAKDGIVTGDASALAGVSIIFSDKVALRFAFDKAFAESCKNSFTFTAVCGERVLATCSDFDELIPKDGYYTLVSNAINAAELGETVTFSGTFIPRQSFTLKELARLGVKIYGKEGRYKKAGELLKAFANFAVAADNYKNGKSQPLPYENKAVETGFTATDGFAPMIASPIVTLTDKQLILDDGMRIRYYLRSEEMNSTMQSVSPVNDLYYFYNCQDVTEYTTKKWVSTSLRKGYIEITLELPVYPSKSHDDLRLMVCSKENLHLALPVDETAPYTSYVHEDYVDRLDAVAEILSKTPGSEQLGSALLYYLQAGAEYYKTQPDLSAFTYPTGFSAGYAREDISPHGFEMDLSSSKISSAVLDPLYTTCLALWDGEELALFFSVDVRQCPDYLSSNSKKLLAREFEIDPDKIFFNATHNHSSPNTTSRTTSNMQRWYDEIFFPKMLLAAKKAVLDLAPATLYTGKANSDPGTNYVRRYVNADGSYTGIHNIVPAANVVAYESEADKELRTLRFARGDQKDILLVNWQGHAAHGAAYSYAATADFVGFLRDGVEKELDVHFIYCNGASGNLNFTPKVKSDKDAKYFTSPYFQGIGKSLAGTVKKAAAAESSIRSGKLSVTYIAHDATVRHDDAATVAKANECQSAINAYQKEKGSYPPASWFQNNYGFQSRYEVSAIRTRAGLGESEILPAWALSFGDVGMAFVPYEMFDSNGIQIREGSPFAVTVIGGYTNDTRSYIPSGFAAPHNGYEVYTSRYVFSTGDEMAAKLTEALTTQRQNAR